MVQVYWPDVMRYAPDKGTVIWLVLGFVGRRVLEITCDTLKLTYEVLVTVPAIESHFAVPAEDSNPVNRSLRLSTFPTSKFHCDDCS